TTDADGLFRPALRLPAPAGDGLLRLEATGSNDAASAQAAVPIFAGRLVVQLALSGLAFAPGGSVPATATVRDNSGNPVAGQLVATELLVPEDAPGPALTSLLGPTDAAGQVTASLPLPLQGSFLVRSVTTDTAGSAVAASQRLWVYAPGSTAAWADPHLPADQTLVTPDQAAYAPGTTA